VLVFPHGDWCVIVRSSSWFINAFVIRYGQLRAEHAPQLLDALAESPFANQENTTAYPVLLEHWRGRMGLTPEDQQKLLDEARKNSGSGGGWLDMITAMLAVDLLS